MQPSFRVFVNTIALYVKMFFTTIISLYLTRVVLNVLGVEDFGIYNLIAGVIAILSFLNSSLMTSTQRFLSVAMGKKDINLIKNFFVSSIIIHIFFALLLIILLECICPFIFDFLTIPINRIGVAKDVYQIMVLSMVVTIVGVPYNSVINANEDLYFFALVEVISAFLKLFVIFIFDSVLLDNLLVYAFWMFTVSLFNFLVKYIWCKFKYKECQKIQLLKINTNIVKQMLSFSGWNALGAFAMVGRNQGIAVILNLYFGTAINAVYGIANQVNGQLSYFSQMLTASTSPQIMKCAGEGNSLKMLTIATFTSKMAFYLSAVFAIPLIIELPFVLDIWLKNVPEYTEEFCGLLVFVFLIMQLYPGLTRAIQANGNIKLYQIYTSIIILLPIIVSPVLFYFDYPSYSICLIMILAQILTLIITVYFSKKLNNLNLSPFIFYVIKAVTLFFIVLYLGSILHDILINNTHGNQISTFFIVTILTSLFFSCLYIFLILDKNEKNMIFKLMKTLINKL